MKSVENKVAIVTGAASGIGKATAVLLSAEGAKVVVSDIDEKGGNEAVEQIKNLGGEALFVRADTARPEDHQALVAQTVNHFGRLDIAVNNAGIGGHLGKTGEYPLDNWQKVIDIKFIGSFL